VQPLSASKAICELQVLNFCFCHGDQKLRALARPCLNGKTHFRLPDAHSGLREYMVEV
jgi:hypothetical protein